jgi:prepilin signal peptidase PulO-like enzyme (type II secretory pathway)
MYELRRIEPLRAANVAGVVYAILTGAIAAIALPFFLALAVLVPSDDMAHPAALLPLLLLYPILGAVMGWISGLLTAAIYNMVVRWTGGLELDLQARGQV